MNSTPISPEVIKLAEEVTLAELLELSQTNDAAVRFICSIRKAFYQSAPDASDHDLLELEGIIGRLYQMIGYDRRSEAFENGNAIFKREGGINGTPPAVIRSQPVHVVPVVQTTKVAERFVGSAASKTVEAAIAKQLESSSSFVFSEIKKIVEDVHTNGGEFEWDSYDNEFMTDGNTRRWEATLQNTLVKKREEEVLFLKSKTKEYLILSAIS